MVYPDQLADAEAAEVLQGLDAAEPGDRVQELDWGRGQTCRRDRDMLGHSDTCSQSAGGRQQQWKLTRDSGAQEVEELAILGVHDGSLNELHHRVAAVFKLGVTPQAKGPWRRTGAHLVWTRKLDLDLQTRRQ